MYLGTYMTHTFIGSITFSVYKLLNHRTDAEKIQHDYAQNC